MQVSKCSADGKAPLAGSLEPVALTRSPHAFHQPGNVQPSNLEAFLDQKPLQHSATREREFHVQLVDPMHQLQIGIRDRTGLIVDAAQADPQHDGLAANAQLGGGVDHFLALGNRPLLGSLEPVAFTSQCVARRTKNRFPASTPRSWRAGSSHRCLVPPRPSVPPRTPRSRPQATGHANA